MSGKEVLLAAGDPKPVGIVNPHGGSRFLLIGDHAGRATPAALGTLGLGNDELDRHIGWDIGIQSLGEALAEALDATFVHQRYSRLVVDCNRDPVSPSCMPRISDGTPVPGNKDLSERQTAARLREIHEPYHQAIAAELDRRRRAGRATVLISLHSFTPALRMTGFERPWQVGVLHHLGDVSFAAALIRTLQASGDLVVGDNEPYAMLGIDYTVPRHAYDAGLPYAEMEIRQDLLTTEAGAKAWSDRLAGALSRAA